MNQNQQFEANNITYIGNFADHICNNSKNKQVARK
jgi:hypothetical protein